jgi:hypothetical protein
MSATEFCSWWAFSAEIMGANVARGKWMRGKLYSSSAELKTWCKSFTHGTRLVWNSFKSTLRDPSKRRDAVIDDTTWAIRRFKFVKLGDGIFRFFLQIS